MQNLAQQMQKSILWRKCPNFPSFHSLFKITVSLSWLYNTLISLNKYFSCWLNCNCKPPSTITLPTKHAETPTLAMSLILPLIKPTLLAISPPTLFQNSPRPKSWTGIIQWLTIQSWARLLILLNCRVTFRLNAHRIGDALVAGFNQGGIGILNMCINQENKNKLLYILYSILRVPL